MKRSAQRMLGLFVVGALLATAVSTGFSQIGDERTSIREVSGEIVTVNLEQRAVAIKQLTGDDAFAYDTITVFINDDTVIQIGNEVVGLDDVDAGKWVDVEYILDPAGNRVAVYIIVHTEVGY